MPVVSGGDVVPDAGGRVAQTGTHEELLAAGGAYIELLASQLEQSPL